MGTSLEKSMLTAAVAAVILVAAGCAAVTAGETEEAKGSGAASGRAQRLYDQAVTAINRQELVVRSHTTEVLVDGIAVALPGSSTWGGVPMPGLDDGPAGVLKLLEQPSKTMRVITERTKDQRQVQILLMEPSQEEWTGLVKHSWGVRLDALQAQGTSLIREQVARVPGSKAEPMQRELQERLRTATDKLNQALQTMRAEGIYKLQYGSGGSRPEALHMETRLHYTEDGIEREETIRSSYSLTRKKD